MSVDKPPDKRLIIYLVLLAVAVLIAWWLSGLAFAVNAPQKPFVSLEIAFYTQPNLVYIPYVYILGTTIEQVIQCESGGRQYNDEGELIRGKANEIGIAQFKQETWDMFNKERGTNLDITSKEDQLDLIYWAFENGYQHHWTCFNEILL